MSETAATLSGVEIFTAGNHRGKDYTPEDLQAIAENFRRFSSPEAPKVMLRVPAVRGHEEADERANGYLQRTDVPADGWATNVWADGDSLYADFDHVTPKMAALIKQKRYRTVSSEIYDQPPDGIPTGGKMLRRVAFLGGEIPEVKGLSEVPDPEPYSENARRGRLRPAGRARIRGGWACFSEVRGMAKHAEDEYVPGDTVRTTGWMQDKGKDHVVGRQIGMTATVHHDQSGVPGHSVRLEQAGETFVVPRSDTQPHEAVERPAKKSRKHAERPGDVYHVTPHFRDDAKQNRATAGRVAIHENQQGVGPAGVRVTHENGAVGVVHRRYLKKMAEGDDAVEIEDDAGRGIAPGQRFLHAHQSATGKGGERVRTEGPFFERQRRIPVRTEDGNHRMYVDRHDLARLPEDHAESDYGAEDEYGYPPDDRRQSGNNKERPGARRDWSDWRPGDGFAEDEDDIDRRHADVTADEDVPDGPAEPIREGDRAISHGMRRSANKQESVRGVVDAGDETHVGIDPGDGSGRRWRYRHDVSRDMAEDGVEIEDDRTPEEVEQSRPETPHERAENLRRGSMNRYLQADPLTRSLRENRRRDHNPGEHLKLPTYRSHSEGDMADEREQTPEEQGDDAEMRKAMLKRLEECGVTDEVGDEIPTSFLASMVRALEAREADAQEQDAQEEQPGEPAGQEAPEEELPMAQEIPEDELPPEEDHDPEEEFAEEEDDRTPEEIAGSRPETPHEASVNESRRRDSETYRHTPSYRAARGRDRHNAGERLKLPTYRSHDEDDQDWSDDDQRMDDDSQEEWHNRRRPHGPEDREDPEYDGFDEMAGDEEMMGERCMGEEGCDDGMDDDDPRHRRRREEEEYDDPDGPSEYDENDEMMAEAPHPKGSRVLANVGGGDWHGTVIRPTQGDPEYRDVRMHTGPHAGQEIGLHVDDLRPNAVRAKNYDENGHDPDLRQRQQDRREINRMRRPIRRPPPKPPAKNAEDDGYEHGDDVAGSVNMQHKGKLGADYMHQGSYEATVHGDQSGVPRGFVRVLHGRGARLVPAGQLQGRGRAAEHAEGDERLHRADISGDDSEHGGPNRRATRHPFDPEELPEDRRLARARRMDRDAAIVREARDRYGSHSEGDEMRRPLKYSELQSVIRREVTAAVRVAIGEAVGDIAGEAVKKAKGAAAELSKHSEQVARAEKKRGVDAVIERLSAEGRLAPAVKEKARRLLLIADSSTPMKFSEGGKTVTKTAFDLQVEQLESVPTLFSEVVKGGTAAAESEDAEVAKVEAHFEMFSERFSRAGASKESLVSAFKAKRKASKVTADEFLGK